MELSAWSLLPWPLHAHRYSPDGLVCQPESCSAADPRRTRGHAQRLVRPTQWSSAVRGCRRSWIVSPRPSTEPVPATTGPPLHASDPDPLSVEAAMAESVYKGIELVGTSSESWESAARAAVERAAQSLRELRV